MLRQSNDKFIVFPEHTLTDWSNGRNHRVYILYFRLEFKIDDNLSGVQASSFLVKRFVTMSCTWALSTPIIYGCKWALSTVQLCGRSPPSTSLSDIPPALPHAANHNISITTNASLYRKMIFTHYVNALVHASNYFLGTRLCMVRHEQPRWWNVSRPQPLIQTPRHFQSAQ